MECDLPGDRFFDLEKGLKQRGFKSILPTLFPSVLGFRDGLGHELILVPKSGRIQIRVHYTTPEKLRKQAARKLAADIMAVVETILCQPAKPHPQQEVPST